MHTRENVGDIVQFGCPQRETCIESALMCTDAHSHPFHRLRLRVRISASLDCYCVALSVKGIRSGLKRVGLNGHVERPCHHVLPMYRPTPLKLTE